MSDPVLIFDDRTGRLVDIDFRGTEAEMLGRLVEQGGGPADTAILEGVGEKPGAARRPGRPKLGVVAREVTLLPRHWDWLAGQPGGASVALRKLVDEARQAGRDKDRVRLAREAVDRFMAAMAGDRPGFEEATRALYAGDRGRFDQLVQGWPADIRDHARTLAAAAF
jgi:hypothetical protein